MTEQQHTHHQGSDESGERTVKDPVCGMSVDPHTAKHSKEHDGKAWHFCSEKCRSKFDEAPEDYLGECEKAQESAPPGATCTCPMHPEIRQQSPGDCPLCGMALEPEQVSSQTGPSEELRNMTRCFWVGLVLALALAAPVVRG